jgi:phage antirepressor YoqD-like protein
MNLVTLRNGAPFTDSLAIAEGTENEHASVIKLVRTYLDDFDSFGLVRFEIRPRPEGQHGGGNVEFAVLNEQQATLLMTYLRNTEVIRAFKRRLVHAFYDLAHKAAAPAFAIPQSLPEALRLAADLADENKKLEGQVAEMGPKVVALTRLSDSEGSFSLREAAKACNVPERKFIQAMHARGWIYKHQGGDWLAYSDKTKAGLLTHKIVVVLRLDGTEKSVERVRVTPKGITRLAEILHSRAA